MKVDDLRTYAMIRWRKTWKTISGEVKSHIPWKGNNPNPKGARSVPEIGDEN